MNKRRSAKTGDFVQIPLEDGTFGYGKVLNSPEIAFLDLRTETTDCSEDILIAARPLFRVWVMQYALKPKTGWRIVGHAALTEDEAKNHAYYKISRLNGKLSIYRSGKQYPNGYCERPATYDECAKLERAAAWGPEHILSRLHDHFSGRENKMLDRWAKRLRGAHGATQ